MATSLLTIEKIRELYDLESDPGETTNLYDAHPEVVADLEARLEKCREDLATSPPVLPAPR